MTRRYFPCLEGYNRIKMHHHRSNLSFDLQLFVYHQLAMILPPQNFRRLDFGELESFILRKKLGSYFKNS